MKGYIVIFICLCTKAVHLDAVTDLTTHAFIATLKRFIARRGRCSHLYSDNGTNFVGANNILKQTFHWSDQQVNSVINNSSMDQLQWHFIPPSSPHFGGLWEAGVKSIKFHLRRTVGQARLTYEELCTVLTQIEACLNSRPLCPLSNDINDLDILTPGHFLTGKSTSVLPEPSYLEKPNLVNRWNYMQKLYQIFWKQWRNEYLQRLQTRPKWNSSNQNLSVGDIVMIHDQNTSPASWQLGRIIETHPGKDGLVRVVTIKTKNTQMKRPITKLSKLPLDIN